MPDKYTLKRWAYLQFRRLRLIHVHQFIEGDVQPFRFRKHSRAVDDFSKRCVLAWHCGYSLGKATTLRYGRRGIARRKVMGLAVSLTTMTDSLHLHNSNP